MPTDFASVLLELEKKNVRYVLVGGLAVVLHGVDRLTADIDLVVDLAAEQVAVAIEALLALGFRTHAPVDARKFADAAVRKKWREESGLMVLSFWDPQNRRPTVDLFAHHPMDFDVLFRNSVLMPLVGTHVRVAALDDLIAIKRDAGRAKDLEDVRRLMEIAARRDLTDSEEPP